MAGQSDVTEPDAPLLRAMLNAGNVFQRVATRVLYGPAGLTLPQYLLLLLLREAGGPLTLGQLAKQSHLIKQAMTPAFERLRAKGFVAELRDPADRRLVKAELTPAGRTLLEQIEPARHALFQRLLGEVPAENKAIAFSVLQRLISAATELESTHQSLQGAAS